MDHEVKNILAFSHTLNYMYLFPAYNTSMLGQDVGIRRFAGTVPNATAKGDIESMAMYAGQGVGLIKEILPAGEVVRRLVEGAQHQIQTHFRS